MRGIRRNSSPLVTVTVAVNCKTIANNGKRERLAAARLSSHLYSSSLSSGRAATKQLTVSSLNSLHCYYYVGRQELCALLLGCRYEVKTAESLAHTPP
jgi:hypothetical protein